MKSYLVFAWKRYFGQISVHSFFIPAIRVGLKLLYFNLTKYTTHCCHPRLLKFLIAGVHLKFVHRSVSTEKLLHDWRYFLVVFWKGLCVSIGSVTYHFVFWKSIRPKMVRKSVSVDMAEFRSLSVCHSYLPCAIHRRGILPLGALFQLFAPWEGVPLFHQLWWDMVWLEPGYALLQETTPRRFLTLKRNPTKLFHMSMRIIDLQEVWT